ncbi:hypothetical protein [Belliella pelovolcani]|uniref:hypothetical protein n=1 Tax=Belliella pelovolcani TaxID=529505 RepID=UPI00391D0552
MNSIISYYEHRSSRNATQYIGDDLGQFGAKYFGMALAINGCLYCTPWNGERVLKIDPTNDTTTFIGSIFIGNSKWIGMAAHTNGKLYAARNSRASILEIDPLTDTTREIPAPFAMARNLNFHPNGKFYSNPTNIFGHWIEFDPINETFIQLPLMDPAIAVDGGSGLRWSVFGLDNKLYTGVANTRRVIRYDPVTGIYDTAQDTFIGGNNSHWGNCVGHNGEIVFANHIDGGLTQILIPSTREYITNPSGRQQANDAGSSGNYAISPAPNGRFYTAPQGRQRPVEVFNYTSISGVNFPYRNKPLGIRLEPIASKYGSIKAAGNASLYLAPLQSSRVLKINDCGTFANFSEVYSFNSNNEPTVYMRGL